MSQQQINYVTAAEIEYVIATDYERLVYSQAIKLDHNSYEYTKIFEELRKSSRVRLAKYKEYKGAIAAAKSTPEERLSVECFAHLIVDLFRNDS